MMMNLLRDKSRNIQFEAFHVFKVRFPQPRIMNATQCDIPDLPGVCRQSQEAPTNRGDSAPEQGQVAHIFA
jgi:hypothetical protein